MKIGIFAGTFRPYHYGHMGLVEKGLLLFDKVYLLIASNPNKKHMDLEQRRLLASAIQNIHNTSTLEVLIPDAFEEGIDTGAFVKKYIKKPSDTCFLIRGVKRPDVVLYEQNLASYNEKEHGLYTVFLDTFDKPLLPDSSLIRKLYTEKDFQKLKIYIPSLIFENKETLSFLFDDTELI